MDQLLNIRLVPVTYVFTWCNVKEVRHHQSKKSDHVSSRWGRKYDLFSAHFLHGDLRNRLDLIPNSSRQIFLPNFLSIGLKRDL